MKETEIIIECAKLDGKQWNTRCVGINLFATNLTYPPEAVGFAKEIKTYGDVRLATEEEIAVSIKRGDFKTLLPAYTIFRDAIVPVIEKVLSQHSCHSFFDALGLIAIKDWNDGPGSPQSYEGDGSYFEMWVLFKATPLQLCEALLRATGKWKD